ncbi:PilZ domain-containing protein [Desulfohalovibrio reitneri]|uniref:PilZ domain-containing protein n=1 Tax=Desulfohalovibrio reitneri TaxID=1307759 RepID=UPI003CC52AD5
MNLSAGGLRFEAPPDSQEHGETAELKIGDRFYLRLDLESPADNESIRYFLYGRVRNAYEDFASRRKEVGLRFLSQARRPSDNPDSLAWSPIDDEAGVESIDNWVFKRHLEMHRERGSSPDS